MVQGDPSPIKTLEGGVHGAVAARPGFHRRGFGNSSLAHE
jgi:hypothetical protein